MGAEEFRQISYGQTAEEAFRKAIESAQYDYGHAGYTGSIAEKNEFVMVPFNGTESEAYDFVDKLLEEDNQKYCSKWGPCGCVDAEPDRKGTRIFLFFGVASC